jgi:hypothetical protein
MECYEPYKMSAGIFRNYFETFYFYFAGHWTLTAELASSSQ